MSQAADKGAAKVPTQNTLKAIADACEQATLSTLPTVAADVASVLKRLSGTADKAKAGLTTATLRLVAKEAPDTLRRPLKDTAEAAGRVPNIATVRTAIVKMAARHGGATALPVWGSVAEAKAAGDAAVQGLAQSCIREDGTQDVEKRAEAEASLMAHAEAFGLSATAQTLLRTALADAVAEVLETAEETAQAEADAAAQAEAEAALQAQADAENAELAAELEVLRAIAGEARRLLGVAADAPMAELLAELQSTDAA